MNFIDCLEYSDVKFMYLVKDNTTYVPIINVRAKKWGEKYIIPCNEKTIYIYEKSAIKYPGGGIMDYMNIGNHLKISIINKTHLEIDETMYIYDTKMVSLVQDEGVKCFIQIKPDNEPDENTPFYFIIKNESAAGTLGMIYDSNVINTIKEIYQIIISEDNYNTENLDDSFSKEFIDTIITKVIEKYKCQKEIKGITVIFDGDENIIMNYIFGDIEHKMTQSEIFIIPISIL